jgi:hypothetical protein
MYGTKGYSGLDSGNKSSLPAQRPSSNGDVVAAVTNLSWLTDSP